MHSRLCQLGRDGGRCNCTPTLKARVKVDDREVEKTFSSLAEAVDWVDRTRRFLRTGVLAPSERRPAIPFGDVAISFIHRARSGVALTRSREKFGSSTLAGYERVLRLHILEQKDLETGLKIEEVAVAGMSGRTIQRVVDHLAANNSASIARLAAAAIAAVLRDAYTRGFVDVLPPKVLLPPPPPSRAKSLDFAEGDRLFLAALADDERLKRSLMAPLVALLLSTGCRISEALELRWDDTLDLEASPPVVRVERSKTRAGIRELPIDLGTRRILEAHRVAAQGATSERVFRRADGAGLGRHGLVRQAFRRIAKSAGVEGTTPHVLRHARASWLASAGVHPVTAAALLGHADGGALFGRVYAHPGKTDAVAAVEAVDALRRSATRGQ